MEALKGQLDELGEIKRMRDEEANRIIQELEREVDEKERELIGENRGKGKDGENNTNKKLVLTSHFASLCFASLRRSQAVLLDAGREGRVGGKYGQRVKCTQVAPILTHFT